MTSFYGQIVPALLTASGTLTADTTVIAGVASKEIRIHAYTIQTVGTNLDLILAEDSSATTERWRWEMQAITSSVFGANLAVPWPAYIFKMGAGEGLKLNVNQSDGIHYSFSYTIVYPAG